jgi:hypothetical protein
MLGFTLGWIGRTSGEAGAAMGRKIGQCTVQNYLKLIAQSVSL